ncbi:MAG: type II toxin-antitoxin system YafQ family toxin [Clostridiales bacterium]|jgi:mRNA interferase YafQ|nr:type II toxin-antitoxin system YafQ family toxin [Clostridiales bacterium]
MLTLKTTTQFRKDYKLMKKRGYNIGLLQEVLQTLLEEKPLAEKHCDHALVGNYTGFRECHILPDWLLIYQVDSETLILVASRTGTHSDLFRT